MGLLNEDRGEFSPPGKGTEGGREGGRARLLFACASVYVCVSVYLCVIFWLDGWMDGRRSPPPFLPALCH